MASKYPIFVNGVPIKSSEALYQACRFPNLPGVQEEIINEASPMAAKMISKKYKSKSREDWDQVKVKIMRWCLRVKLAHHLDSFGQLLLSTGNKPIVEESAKDDYWGAKPNGSDHLIGQNIVGRLLMELREKYRSRNLTPIIPVTIPSVNNFILLGKPILPITDIEIGTKQNQIKLL